MGQQQLLLVILVTIIVGIATVVAINIFGTAADQANRDAVRQDLLGASVQAQAIWARPELMGGANRNFQGGNITVEDIMARLGIPGQFVGAADPDGNPTISPTPTNIVQNENGAYTLAITDSNTLTLTAAPASSPTDTFVMTVRFVEDAGCTGWGVSILDNETNQTSVSGCPFTA